MCVLFGIVLLRNLLLTMLYLFFLLFNFLIDVIHETEYIHYCITTTWLNITSHKIRKPDRLRNSQADVHEQKVAGTYLNMYHFFAHTYLQYH
jgi:hypothetical protein